MSLMIILWKWFAVGTWLLAVSAFCIEVVVKVIVTVSVYGLFLYDSKIREGSWEGLDDAVYYVKAVGNTVEFCFAVFLFFNGGWILFFESGGTIRAVMMVVHAYFNIWCEAKTGWKTFMKRRTAVAKLNSLPFATREDLIKNDDVCAICYMDMLEAKVTRCRHFFHSVCLRKWLYMQDTCPLCHAVLYKDSKKDATNEASEQVDPDQDPVAEADSESFSEDEDDVLDHDDPPYQAPPPGFIDQDSSSSSDQDSDGGSNESSASTRLSSEDGLVEDDIFEQMNHEFQGQDDIIQLMEHISDSSSTRSDNDSSHGEENIAIDR